VKKKNAKHYKASCLLLVVPRECSAVFPTFLLIAIKVNVKNLRGLEGEEKKGPKKQNCKKRRKTLFLFVVLIAVCKMHFLDEQKLSS
jgi:hypothetical protein